MKHFVKSLMTSVMVILPLSTIITNAQNNQKNFQKVYIFGDDLSDTGAFMKYARKPENTDVKEKEGNFDSLAEAKYEAPLYQGSFSNGEVATSIASQNLGFKDVRPFANVTNFKPDLKDGFNFATVGARILKSDPRFFGIDNNNLISRMTADRYNLSEQITMFRKFSGTRRNDLLKDDLAIITIGTNDILDLVEATWMPQVNVKEMAYAKIWQLCFNLKRQIVVLKSCGIENIIIWNLPDLGKLPKYRNNANNYKRNLAYDYSVKFNQLLDGILENYEIGDNSERLSKPKNLKIFNYKLYFANYLNVAMKAKMNIKTPAVRINMDYSFFESNFSPQYMAGVTSENINQYVFFTETHLSGWMHSNLGKELFNFIND